MRRIIWSDQAIDNLENIVAYIDAFNPAASQKIATRFKAAAESLAEFPDRGRSVGGGLRQIASIYPYLIRYRVEDDQVIILRIRHGAQLQD